LPCCSPLLLWLAASCRPVFAAAAAFIIALTIVWTTTFSIGMFGQENFPMAERVLASQAAILAVSLCAIVLASLFSERRESEARLARSNMMLQQERNNKNIDAITSAIVHEVRQPLAAIVSDAGVTFFARETKGSNPSCSTGESATNRAKHGNFTRVEGRPAALRKPAIRRGVEHVAKGQPGMPREQ